MRNFPQELVDSVVGHVDDAKSLSSCTLVASRFVNPPNGECFEGFAIPYAEHEHHALESILRSLPNIKRLAVHGRALRWPAVDEGLKHALQDVIDIVPFCDVLLRTPAYLANIERLGVVIHAIGGLCDGRLLTAVSATLQYLEVIPQVLDALGTVTPFFDYMDLPRMPRVRTLVIDLLIRPGYSFTTQFPSAARTKITLAFPLLESLILKIHVPAHMSSHSRQPAIEDDVHFPHLRRIACMVSPKRMVGDANVLVVKLRSAIEELMPVLRDTSDMLSFDFTPLWFTADSF
ncbi:hypothetical protein C8J57DRAFT_1475786 [Mycena rebaudengoi]|nr:hypothetical protein C8J57DRAFT_1475786 [Mycena rebaudengoi]